MNILRQSTAVTVQIGPFIGVCGVTPVTTIDITSGVSAYAVKYPSLTGGTSIFLGAGNNPWEHIDGGQYNIGLTVTDSGNTGTLRLMFSDRDTITFLSVWEDFEVIGQQYYDSIHGDDYLKVDAYQQAGVDISGAGVTVGYFAGSPVSTGGVTVVSNADKSGYGVASFESGATLISGVTVRQLAATLVSDSGVTIVSNADKTGYTVSTVGDKTGYSVSTLSDKSGITVGWIYSGATLTTGVTVTQLGATFISDGGVTVVSNADKTGYGIVSIESGATLTTGVTVTQLGATFVSDSGVTVVDKTGFNITSIGSGATLSTGVTVTQLGATFVSDSGVTIVSNADKTGYGISGIESGVTFPSGVSLTAQSATDILRAWVEGDYTVRDYLKIMGSVLGSGSTGGGTATLLFYDPSGTTSRVTATVSEVGNRTTVVWDLT